MTAAATMLIPQNDDLALDQLLQAVATEMKSIAEECRDLEVVVGEAFSTLPKGDLLRRLQALDHIIQRSDGLASVMDAIAETAPSFALSHDHVLGGVRLSSLALRLSGKDVPIIAETADEYW